MQTESSEPELEARVTCLTQGRDRLILVYDAETYRGPVLKAFGALLRKSAPLREKRRRTVTTNEEQVPV